MSDLQRTDDWHRRRWGKVTASRLSDVLATTAKGPAASRQKYLTELAIQRANEFVAPPSSYASPSMLKGIEREPLARAEFIMRTRLPVTEIDFVDHPTIPMAGASPDGMVGDDAVLEIKCPEPHTHLEYLEADCIPARYRPQVQWQLACTERGRAHFVSFCPEWNDLEYFHCIEERDDAYIAKLEKSVWEFLSELDLKVEKVNLMRVARKALAA